MQVSRAEAEIRIFCELRKANEMTPGQYVDEIVKPTLIEFKFEPTSRRRAYLACITIFHVKDHLIKHGEQSVEDTLRTEVGEAFDVVRAICNGTKHLEANGSHPIPFRAGDDYERAPAIAGHWALGYSQAGDQWGGREIPHTTLFLDLYGYARCVMLGFQTCYPELLGACNLGDC